MCGALLGAAAAAPAAPPPFPSPRPPLHPSRHLYPSPGLGALTRAPSERLSELLHVSRAVARAAIDAEGGDINAAAARLLAPNLLIPQPPERDLAELGGISLDDARELITAAGGDVGIAKRALLDQLGIAAEERFTSSAGGEVAVEEGGGGSLGGGGTPHPTAAFCCSLCLDDKAAADGFSLSCGCTFCTPCLRQYPVARMAEGDTTIACPSSQPGCSPLTQRELRRLLGRDAFATLDRRALEAAVAVDASLHLCRSPDCTYIVSWAGPEDGAPVMKCPLCAKQRCLVCGGECADTGAHDCASAAVGGGMTDGSSSAAAAAEEEEATKKYIAESGIRICKRCGAGVIKEVGCHKLRCRCGYVRAGGGGSRTFLSV